MRAHLLFVGVIIAVIGPFSATQLAQDDQVGRQPPPKQSQTPGSYPKQEHQETEYSPSTPEFERRDRPVTKEDLLIVKRAGEILSDETK